MAACVDLKELEVELSRTKNAVDAWVRGKAEAAQQTRDAHLQAMQDQSGKLASLRTRQAQLGIAVQQVRQRAEREEQETNSLQATATAAEKEQHDVEQKVALLRSQVQALEQDCMQQEEAANLEESIKKKKVVALRKALALYSMRLGLEFKQSEDVLQLVFTHVDASLPLKQFVVGVNVQNGQSCTYKVTNCSPNLECMPALESKLNSTNDFSEFVKSVRLAFKALSSGPY